MSELRIHGYLVSTWTRTACMVAIEKGVSYELLPIARGSTEHRAMHPFAKMPVVEHDGTVISEALAITGYIDEAFPGPPLQPAGDPELLRQMRTWMSVCSDYVFRDVVRGIPRGRAPSEDQMAAASTVLERVDAMIGDGRFLAGDRLTLADLYLAPQASNAREKAPELFERFRALSAWLAGVEARPSFTATAYDPAAL